MTTIAILGSGNVGRGLAGRLSVGGYQVVVGSRDPGAAAASWDVEGVRLTGHQEAAAAGDVVVNALPGDACLGVLRTLAPRLAGKVLVDVANATVPDAQGFADALLYPDTSLAEEIQRLLPDTRVVKTLNTMHVSLMAAPDAPDAGGEPDVPATVFVSGDDSEAKAETIRLLAELGWRSSRIIDLGDLRTARVPEAFILMVGPLVRALGPVPFALTVAH